MPRTIGAAMRFMTLARNGISYMLSASDFRRNLSRPQREHSLVGGTDPRDGLPRWWSGHLGTPHTFKRDSSHSPISGHRYN